MNREEEFYKKLKETLLETTKFPTKYMYKFIIPNSKEKFEEVEDKFDNMGAVINSKLSKSGKYNSITIVVNMKSPDEIIAKYKEVAQIEGVVSL